MTDRNMARCYERSMVGQTTDNGGEVGGTGERIHG